MEDFFKKAKDAIVKTAGDIADWFNASAARGKAYVDEQKTKSQPAKESSVSDMFAPVNKVVAQASAKLVPISVKKAPAPAPEKVEAVKKTVSTINDFLKDVARAAPRAAASSVLSATGVKEYQPGTGQYPSVEKFLFGEKPIQDIKGTGEETLGAFGASESTKKSLGVPVGIALTALDLWPGFGKKDIVERIARETEETAIRKILSKEMKGVAEESIDALSKILAPIKEKKKVKGVLDAFAELQKGDAAAKAGSAAVKGKKAAEEIAPYYEKNGANLMEIENTDLTTPELRRKLSIAKEGNEDASLIRQIEDDLTARTTKSNAKSVKEIIDEAGGAEQYAKNKVGSSGKAAAKTSSQPERRFITRTKQMAPEAENILKGSYTPRSTEKLIEEADSLIKTNRAQAEILAKTGTDDKAVAVASRLIDNLVSEAKAAKSEITKNAIYEKMADIANAAAKNLTEQGRSVQAASILGRQTPEGMARYAARQIQKYNEGVEKAKGTLGGLFKSGKKIPELTGEQIAGVTKRMEEIEKIEDATKKAMEFQKLQKDVQAMVPSSLYDKIITVWKAGLLTGIKTSGLNILSNASHAASEIAKDVPAAVIDRILSIFTGKRTLAITGKGAGKGIKEGIQKGWRYLRTGFDERDIGTKLDYKQVNFGTSKLSKAIQSYEEAVFRLLGSEDQPFYYAAKTRSMSSQAIAEAKNAGLKGKEAKQFVENLLKNPTDDMIKYATLDAETAVFQNKTALGKVAKALQKAPGGEIVAPFGRTPSAVATQLINYSPVGIVKTIVENIGKGRFDQRLLAQGLGRGITGTAALYIGGRMLNNGLITLDWPTSEKEQKQWEAEGRVPNSIKIGGKWRTVGALGPLGMTLVVGGHIQQAINETGSLSAGMATILPGIFSTVGEQTFLKGVNQAMDAINDPQRSFRGFATSLAGSLIPTIVSDVARATDQYERRADYPGTRIQSRIPGVRTSLEPKIDVFGTEIKTPGFLTTMIDATRPGTPSQPTDDKIVLELRRLSDAGYQATPTQLGPKRGYETLSDEQNTQLWQLAGQFSYDAIERIMKTAAYKNRYDDEQKAKVINEMTDQAKVEARGKMLSGILSGIPKKQIAQKLREYKEDNLLTQQVFARLPRNLRPVKWKEL
jgi:hypothetical protein